MQLDQNKPRGMTVAAFYCVPLVILLLLLLQLLLLLLQAAMQVALLHGWKASPTSAANTWLAGGRS